MNTNDIKNLNMNLIHVYVWVCKYKDIILNKHLDLSADSIFNAYLKSLPLIKFFIDKNTLERVNLNIV